MKLNKFLYGAMALCMFASCSDNDSIVNGGDGGNQVPGGESYLGVSLELPQEPSTRGANDVFDDGIKKEYSIKNAALVLFKGETESTSKFIGAYELGTEEAFDQPNGDNVTVSFQKAIKLLSKPEFGSKEELWGLAIVNYDEDIYTVNSDASLDVATTDGKKSLTSTDAITFSTFRNYITNNDFMSNGFFMTNAPLSNKPGMSSNPTGEDSRIRTLAMLSKDAFQKTEVEAIQNPAGCIFVERAVAKITCSSFPSSVKIPYTKVELTESGVPEYTTEEYELKIAGVEWMVDNEEETSYIIRNATTTPAEGDSYWAYHAPQYRFVGAAGMSDNTYDANEVHKEETTWYRTYWCIDPAYGVDKKYNDQTTKENAFTALTLNGEKFASDPEKALYPHENTFNVTHQNYKNTTRVVFKVKYASMEEGKNIQLYAVRGQLQTFYLENDAKNLFKRTVLGSTKLHDLILNYAKDNSKIDYNENSFVMTFGPAATANSTKGIEKGDYILTSLSFDPDFVKDNFRALTEDDQNKIATELADIATSANNANHVVEFKDNTCYYATYLRHFGDTYCKFPTNDWTGTTVEEVYKNAEGNIDSNRFLGRYGLVRNNWYDLSVNVIKTLGTATVPNGNVETSDDNNKDEWYLSARVHILSWAKRTQYVEF